MDAQDGMADDKIIESVMQEAAQYAVRGMEHLIANLADEQGELRELLTNYGKLANGLEVHFLFPNLNDRERSLLAELLEARRGVYAAMKAGRGLLNPENVQDHEKVNAAFQTRYVNARTEVATHSTLAKLTELQQKILEKEFLSLPITNPPASGHTGISPRA